jgi:hypothetical protein
MFTYNNNYSVCYIAKFAFFISTLLAIVSCQSPQKYKEVYRESYVFEGNVFANKWANPFDSAYSKREIAKQIIENGDVKFYEWTAKVSGFSKGRVNIVSEKNLDFSYELNHVFQAYAKTLRNNAVDSIRKGSLIGGRYDLHLSLRDGSNYYCVCSWKSDSSKTEVTVNINNIARRDVQADQFKRTTK